MEGYNDLGSHMVGWQTLRLKVRKLRFDIAKCTVDSSTNLVTFNRQLA